MRISTLASVVAGTLMACAAANLQAQTAELLSDGSNPRVSTGSTVPEAAAFIGLGGSGNFATFPSQEVYAQGLSSIFQDGTVRAVGSASGSTGLEFDTAFQLAPLAQAGYFRHFSDSRWLWGGKLAYSYLAARSTIDNALIPQAGGFTGVETSSFTGNVLVPSYEVSIHDQFVLAPFLGRSFEHCFLYIGGGPSISRTKTKLLNSIGFADINGMTTDITGSPTTFSSSKWLWGGAAVAGICYFFHSSWFLDLNYTFSATRTPASDFSSSFSSSNPRFTTEGVVSGNYSGRVLTHTIAITINRAF